MLNSLIIFFANKSNICFVLFCLTMIIFQVNFGILPRRYWYKYVVMLKVIITTIMIALILVYFYSQLFYFVNPEFLKEGSCYSVKNDMLEVQNNNKGIDYFLYENEILRGKLDSHSYFTRLLDEEVKEIEDKIFFNVKRIDELFVENEFLKSKKGNNQYMILKVKNGKNVFYDEMNDSLKNNLTIKLLQDYAGASQDKDFYQIDCSESLKLIAKKYKFAKLQFDSSNIHKNNLSGELYE